MNSVSRKSPFFFGSDTGRLIKRLFAQSFRTHWKSYAFAIALMMVVAATTSLSAWIIGVVVNQIFIAHDLAMLVPLSIGIIVISVVKGVANYGQEVALGRIGNRMVAENQTRVYNHLLKFGIGYFTTQPSSNLIMVVSGGANSARDVVNTLVVSFGRDFLTLAGLLFVMIYQAPLLSSIALVVAPLAITGVTKLVKRVRSIATSEFQLGTRVIQILQETTHGARMVKVFNLNPYMRGRMNEAVAAVQDRANKIVSLQARTGPLMETLGGVSVGLVTLYSGWATIAGGQTPGSFMAFVTALLLAYEPAKRLARLHVNLSVSIIGARMMFNLLDTPPSVTEDSSLKPLEFKSGTIEFRKVGFGYRPGVPVLEEVSFKVARNSKIALVGPSGGGKTTILTLIPRLYDVDSGSITIDGQDIRETDAETIRRQIAFVSQDTYLFGGTIRENICIGRLDATDSEIESAARDAYADEFIRTLPQGYDTDVGENGVQLSGGQRQRVAIARAILKRAPVILLDEATSALDSESERQVQLAFDRLMDGRTIIVIAHRLSTVLNADRILVIDKGRIVEAGSHRELLANGGLYQTLYKQQFADHVNERPLRTTA